VALSVWILDKSVAARVGDDAVVEQLRALDGELVLCEIGMLEQLFSAVGGKDHRAIERELSASFAVLVAPPDLLARTRDLQRDLALHRGRWHRRPLPDLMIAVTALHHGAGVVHADRDYELIAAVRPLRHHRISVSD
jgi:predicted nucleic acid-binding protein